MKRKDWIEPLEWISIGVFIGVAMMIMLYKCCAQEVRLERYEDGIATIELSDPTSGEYELVDIINSNPMKVIVVE